jgi:small ubiquitin-related modifier
VGDSEEKKKIKMNSVNSNNNNTTTTTSSSDSNAANEAKPEEGESKLIQVILQTSGGGQMFFKLKRHATFGKLFSVYKEKANIDPKTHLRFSFDGQRISEHDTPQGLEMETNDVIDVFYEQVGGSKNEMTFLFY